MEYKTIKKLWQQMNSINNMCGPTRFVSTYLTQQIVDQAIVTRPMKHPLTCDDGTVLTRSGFVYEPGEIDEPGIIELPGYRIQLPQVVEVE